MGTDEVEDLLEGQVLVLRHVEPLDVRAVEARLLAAQDIFEEVDRDVVYGKQNWSEQTRQTEDSLKEDLP